MGLVMIELKSCRLFSSVLFNMRFLSDPRVFISDIEMVVQSNLKLI